MAMFKGLMGGAAGAAMYTAYRDSETIFSSKDLATGLYDYWQKKGAGNIAEVSRLQKNVDDLQHALLKSLHDRQQPTVIYAGGSKSGWGTASGVVVLVGGVALYLRFVKGWRLADFMYVTRASLTNIQESMKQGMDTMRAQLEARAGELLERMSVLGGKQEELLEQQGALGDELALVNSKVGLVSDQVGFSNHAILLLCGALSEMAKRVGISNGRYVKELEHLTRSVATTGGLPAPAAGAALAALPGLQGGVALDGGYHAAAGGPAAAAAAASSPAMQQGPPSSAVMMGGPNPAVFSLPASNAAMSGNATAAEGGVRRRGETVDYGFGNSSRLAGTSSSWMPKS